MNVELVVARYCEDLGWLDACPSDWKRTVYDKSVGGPREIVHARGYSNPSGPDRADLWPGSRELPNVGAESHSYLTHIVRNYHRLADYTVFTQGDPFFHDPCYIETVQKVLESGAQAAVLGPEMTCDADGWPQHDVGSLPHLVEMFRVFWPTDPIPTEFVFHAGCFPMASRDVLRQTSLSTWAQALARCTTKLHACAIERLYDRILEVTA